jgi:hypothetical protein
MARTWIISFLVASVALASHVKKVQKGDELKMDLVSRYARLACAVVQVSGGDTMGTGFFINEEGDLLTAAHVALSRVFFEPSPGAFGVFVDYKPNLQVHRNGEEPVSVKLPRLTDDDVKRATADLAILHTGLRTPCYLKIGDSAGVAVGQHLIGIGYPSSAPSGALYDGFLSAKYPHLRIPVASISGKPIYPTYEVFRVQMPITPGASGAPIIADDDSVIGVQTESPIVWFNDLTKLIDDVQKRSGGFDSPISDDPKLLAELAWLVREFESPGAGLAVPVSYLKPQEPREAKPATPTAAAPAPRSHHGWFRSLIDHLK